MLDSSAHIISLDSPTYAQNCECIVSTRMAPHTSIICLTSSFLTITISIKVLHDLFSLSICSVSLPHSLHLNPVSGDGLEGGQSVGGVTVGRLSDSDGAILGGVGHSEGVALGVAG